MSQWHTDEVRNQLKINIMSKITSQKLTDFREALETFLEAYGEENGLVFKVGAMTYSPNNFTFRTEANVGGSKEEVEEREFMRNVIHFNGLSKRDYAREFLYGGKKYKLVGLNTRSPKYGVIAEDVRTKKRYKLITKSVTKILTNERA